MLPSDTSLSQVYPQRFALLSYRLVGIFGFTCFLLTVAAIIYFDDIQITDFTSQEVPTIYNMRIAGFKILDFISLSLFSIVICAVVLKGTFEVNIFHRTFFILLGIYCYAGFVGFIYSFIYQYDYVVWMRDFQQIIYYFGFFLITYIFLDSKRKWNVFVISLVTFMALKNVFITYKTFMGEGKIFGDWAIRASQNSEFAYFPMMFFSLFALILYRKNTALKIAVGLIVFLYLFNSLIGIYRTVWVILILGTMYFFTLLTPMVRRRTSVYMIVFISLALMIISAIFPRFLALAWNYKFASIFEWKVEGDRSNATRVIEIMNVFDYIFRHYSFLQGLGLGAFWDDAARRLLPDGGSGFMFKTRFYTTHMFMLTQFLKLGFVATFIYWFSIGKLFLYILRRIKAIPWERWEKCILIGMHVGFFCGYISNADFVRMFLLMGINLGLTARYFSLEDEQFGTTTVPA
ncbi:MAG: hypothetical protein ACOYNS_00445 [Bacteroidota bacterium]